MRIATNAIQLLKRRIFVIRLYCKGDIKIDKYKTVLDSEFVSVKQYLTKLKTDLLEFFKKSFKLDFIPGNKYMSCTIFSRLLNVLKKEIIYNVGTNYPSLTQNFDNYSEVIKTLTVTKIENNRSKDVQLKLDKTSKQSKPYSALQNFNTNVKNSFICKFCLTENHCSMLCPKFLSLEFRYKAKPRVHC